MFYSFDDVEVIKPHETFQLQFKIAVVLICLQLLSDDLDHFFSVLKDILQHKDTPLEMSLSFQHSSEGSHSASYKDRRDKQNGYLERGKETTYIGGEIIDCVVVLRDLLLVIIQLNRNINDMLIIKVRNKILRLDDSFFMVR